MRSWQSLALSIVTVVLAVSTATMVAGETLTLAVEGLTETGCSSPPAVQGTAKRFPAVREARVSLERGEMTLDYEGDRTKLEEVLSTVEKMCQVKIIRPGGGRRGPGS